ncbi:DNA-protecting protein DprA [Candidatus Microgenomates bacterium]|nr:DNA-protecting protein DprA [Candidatus Microgenomates bacterium]
MKIKQITDRHENYPKLLTEIASPPKKLFYIGKLPADQPCVAIVGSRKATAYGRQVTEQLAGELAACGIIIISGLALGIDAIAHRAAVASGGRSLAVMGCGLDQIYPASNRGLAKQMLAQGGGLISEYEAGTPPLKHHFPARNRIITGLSLAVVITEAAAHSGALITANFALEQNRLVMAVPGNTTSKSSEGANNLLKAGAMAVTEARDVLNALDLEVPELKAKIARPASKEEALILDLLAQEITDSEELIVKSGWDAVKFNQVISLMELSGKVRNLGGGKWISR